VAGGTSDIIPEAALLLPQGPMRQLLSETPKKLGGILCGGVCQVKSVDINF